MLPAVVKKLLIRRISDKAGLLLLCDVPHLHSRRGKKHQRQQGKDNRAFLPFPANGSCNHPEKDHRLRKINAVRQADHRTMIVIQIQKENASNTEQHQDPASLYHKGKTIPPSSLPGKPDYGKNKGSTVENQRNHPAGFLRVRRHRSAVVPERLPKTRPRAFFACGLFLCIRCESFQFLCINVSVESEIVIPDELRLLAVQTDALIEALIGLIIRNLLKIVQLRSRIKKTVELLPVRGPVTEPVAELSEPQYGKNQDEHDPHQTEFLLAVKRKLQRTDQKGKSRKRADEDHHLRAEKIAQGNQKDRRKDFRCPSLQVPGGLHRKEPESRRRADHSDRHGILQEHKMIQKKSRRSKKRQDNSSCLPKSRTLFPVGSALRRIRTASRCVSTDAAPSQNPSEDKRQGSVLAYEEEQAVPVRSLRQPVQASQHCRQREAALDIPKLRRARVAPRENLSHQGIIIEVIVIRPDASDQERRGCRSRTGKNNGPDLPAVFFCFPFLIRLSDCL